ncbi:MAG: ATP-dependent DNA helicase RecG [Acidimicrobiales bacterium]
MSKDPITARELAAMDIDVVKGIGEKKKDALESFGISSVLDLIETYPRRWIDRTREAQVAQLEEGVPTLVVVTVDSTNAVRTRSGKRMVTVRTSDDSGRLSLTFFNQGWREKQLVPGLTIAVFGKPERYRGYLQMTNPVVDLIGDRTGRIVPVYPQSDKSRITTWDLARWIESTLARCVPRGIADPVPGDVIGSLRLVERGTALHDIHLPESIAHRDAARRRLAFDEVLRVQVMLVARKLRTARDSRGISHRIDGPLIDRFDASLPFPLTTAQRRVISEITHDMASPTPMHRLLQGDVGAGKTVVAVSAMMRAVQGGHQASLMVPTEVLAEQHLAGVRRLLDGLEIPDAGNLFGGRPVRVELLTNRVTGEQRRQVLAGLADGSVDVAVGTHALIQEGVSFAALGLVVVDEQHRFGVEQRARLRDKSADGAGTPDVLVMTATPIPRTAAMTVYGDLDVSVLDELPPGRTPIDTGWANNPVAEAAVWADVRSALERGEQTYVVCPLIEESEKLEVASAEQVRDELAAGELSGHTVELLHGRMTSNEKEAVMERFRSASSGVLVATTVIEVGVDVPNATRMVILDADRFGIAQLHQLRGRVGRGTVASRCHLVTRTDDPSPRVEALVNSTDGFVLAEEDLRLRGEGTLMGTIQKGRSDLRLASLQGDLDLIQAARTAAVAIVGDDPDLAAHPLLADEIDLYFTEEQEDNLLKG